MLGVVAVWAWVCWTGASHEALGDLAYLPVVIAGFVWAEPGGLAVGALAAGLLTTGLVPHDGTDRARWVGALVYALSGLLAGIAGRVRHRRMTTLVVVADRLSEVYSRSLLLAAQALELRAVDTAGHSQRVANTALALGRDAGLADDDLVLLYWAALLHDVGKIAVPEAILHKPGKLTNAEWAIMTSHPAVGARLVSEMSDEFEDLARAVRGHHENWDGTGYPDGLAGNSIPRAARLLSVVDVFDALTSPRPYRTAMSRAEARDHIASRRGTQFDPAAVDLLLNSPAVEEPGPGVRRPVPLVA